MKKGKDVLGDITEGPFVPAVGMTRVPLGLEVGVKPVEPAVGESVVGGLLVVGVIVGASGREDGSMECTTVGGVGDGGEDGCLVGSADANGVGSRVGDDVGASVGVGDGIGVGTGAGSAVGGGDG